MLAIDGPAALPWDAFVTSLGAALAAFDVAVLLEDARDFFAPWAEVERRTATAVLPGDPVFGRIFDGDLAELVDGPQHELPAHDGTTVLFGPGSALQPHDRLWYAAIPKSLSLERVRAGIAGNVGQPVGERGLGAAAPLRRLAAARPPRAGAPPAHRPLRRSRPTRGSALARGRGAARVAAGSRRTAVPRAADVPTGAVGRSVAAAHARDRDGRAEPRLVVRADHARERCPARG